MRLLRVQVPEFRALKDVDISFEPDFTPQVFPLGSLNGGGKSTLLQLIFVLLHCSADYKDKNYIKNLLEDFIINYDLNKQIIAILDILLNNQIVKIEFFCCNNEYLETLPSDKEKSRVHSYSNLFDFLNDVFRDDIADKMIKLLKEEEGIFYLCSISKEIGVFCKIHENTEINKSEVLSNISKNIFLISPSTQSYLFLSRKERRFLFTSENEKTYDKILKDLNLKLPNFFTYEFLDVITEVCRLERDKDFDEKLATGIYGTHYENLENDINNLFIDGKKIIPLTVQQKRHTKDAIQSMGFKLPSGEEIYPEDLSHGELKRLAIFVLIKYHEIKDSIVLFDEIENGFHPDWQYKIVRDLVEWGKNNQYILATHSYELCTAVTPAHVKELEPRLTKEAL